jgi:hypothetical protein
MKKSRWITLAIFLVTTVMLSGCIVAGYGDGRYDHDHDRGEHRDGDR